MSEYRESQTASSRLTYITRPATAHTAPATRDRAVVDAPLTVVVGVAVGVAGLGDAVGDEVGGVGGAVGEAVGIFVGGEAVGIWVGGEGVGAGQTTVAHASTPPSASASIAPTTMPFTPPEPVPAPATMDWWHKTPSTSLQHKISRPAIESGMEGVPFGMQFGRFSASPGWVQSVHPSGKNAAKAAFSVCRHFPPSMAPWPVEMAPPATTTMAAAQHWLS